MKLVGGGGGADRAGHGVAKRTASSSSEPEAGELGTDTADVPGSLQRSQYKRMKRLYDNTPAELEDAERLDIVAGVMRMIDNRRPA